MNKLFFALSITAISIFNAPDTNAQLKKEGIKWNGIYEHRKAKYDTTINYYNFYLKSVSYILSKKELWKIDLPERMCSYIADEIYNKVSLASSGTYEELPKDKIDINNNDSKAFLRCPILITDSTIAISDKTGFLLLNKFTGKTITDIEYKSNEKDFFWYDRGKYTIKVKDIVCTRENTGESFIAKCSGYLFHFNGSKLFVFNNENNLIEEIQYNSALHLQSNVKLPMETKAIFKSKNFTLEMEGTLDIISTR